MLHGCDLRTFLNTPTLVWQIFAIVGVMVDDEKIVYLVRHGESESNAARIIQSHDSPLSPLGKTQAELIAARVSRISFDALISSPYTRAKETAEAIARRTGRNPEYSELFVERIKPSGLIGQKIDAVADTELRSAWEASIYTPGMRV